MINVMKKNKLLTVIGLSYLLMLLLRKDLASIALQNSSYYLVEMVQILPVIFMLTVAIEVLIPKEWIVKRLGKRSGIMGALLALAFGSLSAGPIYAAFPIAKTLHKKGASIGNVVVILSAWAVIKVPMLANEAKFLGPEFMAVRWGLTVILIILMGLLMEWMHIKIQDEADEPCQSICVKKEYCIGCSACAKKLPSIFAMEAKKAIVRSPKLLWEELNSQEQALLKNIVQQCPPKAIVLNDALE